MLYRSCLILILGLASAWAHFTIPDISSSGTCQAPQKAPNASIQPSSPKAENVTAAVVRAFETHDIVMFGEIHGNKQEYEWLRSLVSTPAFADQVDDVVLEYGNSLYQRSVDRYVSGGDVPLEQVQKAWRNTVADVGPPSPVVASLYKAIRDTNVKRKGKHQMRIVCGDPYIDWDTVKAREDVFPYLGNRDQRYTQVVKDEVLARHHRALLIMGSGHFMRGYLFNKGASNLEKQLRQAGASTYLIVFGTNATGGYDDLDQRFDSWPAPSIVSLAEGWVGELPAIPVTSGGVDEDIEVNLNIPEDSPGAPSSPLKLKDGGDAPKAAGVTSVPPKQLKDPPEPMPAPTGGPKPPLKLKDAADALLYLGPRDSLTAVFMSRAELDGTAYGKEIERRQKIQFAKSINFITEKEEAPLFSRPKPDQDAGGLPAIPPPRRKPPYSLPPRPPSQ